VLPIVLAILLKLLLQPGVRRLERVRIPRAIAAYLLTVTIMNAAVGVGTRLATWATGLGNPTLWGVMAFLLNYIPVIEPIISLVLLLLAGLLTIEPLWSALLPGAGFFAIHAIEGQSSRRFTLNPVVVIVSLGFWYWMWGVPGAILAVPVLGIVKIICDNIRPWAAIGHLMRYKIEILT
jgi:predicted PurR-regulated permease PerM